MKPRARISRRVVQVLKNPTAKFVSIVDHGANQNPFDTVKQANGDKSMARTPIKKVRKPKGSTKTVAKANDEVDVAGDEASAVLRFTFSKEHFESEDDVQKYLDKNGWEECEIGEEDDAFVVKSTVYSEDDFDEDGVREVEVTDDEGIIAFVGKLADTDDTEEVGEDGDEAEDEDDDTDDEDPKPTKKSAKAEDEGDEGEDGEDAEDLEEGEEGEDGGEEAGEEEEEEEGEGDETVTRTCHPIKPVDQYIRKFDHYGAYISGSKTVAEVLEDGMVDGVPPGVEEILLAVRKSIGNALKDGNNVTKAVSGIASELAETVVAIDTVWRKLLKSGDKAQKAAAKEYIASLESDTALQTSAKSIKGPELSSLVTKAVSEAVSKAVAPLNEKLSKQAETIAKLRKGVPARKSMNNDDTADNQVRTAKKTQEQDDEDYISSLSVKGIFGSTGR